MSRPVTALQRAHLLAPPGTSRRRRLAQGAFGGLVVGVAAAWASDGFLVTLLVCAVMVAVTLTVAYLVMAPPPQGDGSTRPSPQ